MFNGEEGGGGKTYISGWTKSGGSYVSMEMGMGNCLMGRRGEEERIIYWGGHGLVEANV